MVFVFVGGLGIWCGCEEGAAFEMMQQRGEPWGHCTPPSHEGSAR